jgi:hypothetical protein
MTAQHALPHQLFTSGDSAPLAELRPRLEEFAARYDLPLNEDVDDLDTFKFVMVPLTAKSQACLYRYDGDPHPGTLVRVDSRADLTELWEKLRRVLDLREGDWVWVNPEATVQAAPSWHSPCE